MVRWHAARECSTNAFCEGQIDSQFATKVNYTEPQNHDLAVAQIQIQRQPYNNDNNF